MMEKDIIDHNGESLFISLNVGKGVRTSVGKSILLGKQLSTQDLTIGRTKLPKSTKMSIVALMADIW